MAKPFLLIGGFLIQAWKFRAQ